MRKSDDKKSFQLYNDYIDHFSLMSDEEAGKLIKAIFCYVNDLPCEELAGLSLMAFSFISSQLKRDKDKYDARCEANRINGRLGGRPKKMKEGGKADEESRTVAMKNKWYWNYLIQRYGKNLKKKSQNGKKRSTLQNLKNSGRCIQEKRAKARLTRNIRQD